MATAEAELWQVSVTTRGAAMPELPEELEEDALSVSTFEIEDEATATPLGWRIDLLYRERPDPAPIEAALAQACATAGSVLEGVAVEPVPENDWVAAASLRLPPLVAGR